MTGDVVDGDASEGSPASPSPASGLAGDPNHPDQSKARTFQHDGFDEISCPAPDGLATPSLPERAAANPAARIGTDTRAY
jgi:hypothetical protein